MRPGNRSYVVNSQAVRRAAQVRYLATHTVIQNNNLRQMIGRRRVSDLVRDLVTAPATARDYQNLAAIFQEAQVRGLDDDQLDTRIRDTTPFAGITRFIPKDHALRVAYIALLVAILQLVADLRPQTQVITPKQIKQIIEQVVEQVVEHDDEDNADGEEPSGPSPSSGPPAHPGRRPE
jgi:hypothetical protein